MNNAKATIMALESMIYRKSTIKKKEEEKPKKFDRKNEGVHGKKPERKK